MPVKRTQRSGKKSARATSARVAKPKSKSSANPKSSKVTPKSSASTRKKKVSAKSAPKRPVTKTATAVNKSPLLQAVVQGLEDMKAVNVKVLDVRDVTDFADTLVIASGNSDRHV
ncbi:MAG: RsfS/YbeB/iojap family protein, partial [Candidatus Obscuribacterales bacterium]|nr:RsfS/YbeB/iojap family protein [Steroidobacteraceae bacterium]